MIEDKLETFDLTIKQAEQNKEFVKCNDIDCTFRGFYRRCYFTTYLNCENYFEQYKTQ